MFRTEFLKDIRLGMDSNLFPAILQILILQLLPVFCKLQEVMFLRKLCLRVFIRT